MDKNRISQLCTHILGAANSITVAGESNAAQILGICRAVREIAAEVNKQEGGEGDG